MLTQLKTRLQVCRLEMEIRCFFFFIKEITGAQTDQDIQEAKTSHSANSKLAGMSVPTVLHLSNGQARLV